VALLAVNHYSPNIMATWGFGSLWGGNAAKKKDSTKNAILGLRSTLEMLSKREKHLQNQMDEQDAIARKNVSSNKGGEYMETPDGQHTYYAVTFANRRHEELQGQQKRY
jgi:hypothetical protein